MLFVILSGAVAKPKDLVNWNIRYPDPATTLRFAQDDIFHLICGNIATFFL